MTLFKELGQKMLYDQLILENDAGCRFIILFVHGYRITAGGDIDDVTEIISIYQSADKKIFNVESMSEESWEVVYDDLTKRRGYKIPGSDTQSKAVVDVDEWDEDLDCPNPEDYVD